MRLDCACCSCWTVPALVLARLLIARRFLLREGQSGAALHDLLVGLFDARLLRVELGVQIGDVGLRLIDLGPRLLDLRLIELGSMRISTAPASTTWLSVTLTSLIMPEICGLIATMRVSMKASSVDSYCRACSHHRIAAAMTTTNPTTMAAISQGRCRSFASHVVLGWRSLSRSSSPRSSGSWWTRFSTSSRGRVGESPACVQRAPLWG